MSSERDPSLPDGLTDLIELIAQQQLTTEAVERFKVELRGHARRLAPFIFRQLYQSIDHDLLFTTEADLVMPKIREATREILFLSVPDPATRRTSSTIPRDKELASEMLDVVSLEAWAYIRRQRR